MDLTFTEEQQLLKQSAERYLAERYSFADRQKHLSQAHGWQPSVWADFASFGWLSLPFSPENEGLGAGAVELAILGQAFGAALVVEPYLPTIVLSGFLLEGLGDARQRAQWLGPLVAGRTQMSLAHEESAGRHGPAPIGSEARKHDGAWRIRGRKTTVLGGPTADHFLVSAILVDEGHTTALFIVPRTAKGLTVRPYTLLDGTQAAQLRLDDVAVDRASRLNSVSTRATERRNPMRTAIDRAIDRGIMFQAAHAAGAMRAVLQATIEYTKTRQQFGQPLAANQVIKHRLVDMAIAVEEANAIALRAALLADHSSALAAKIKVSRAARYVAEQAIQLHGGMGVTEELNIGAYFKSLLSFELLFGSAKRYGSSQFRHIRDRALGDLDERRMAPLLVPTGLPPSVAAGGAKAGALPAGPSASAGTAP